MNELFALIKAEEQLTSALSVGSYIVEPVLQEKTVQPTREEQEITYDYGFNGLEKVIVEPYEPILQTKTITPTTEQQVITADSGNDGLGEVVVNGVDSSIDSDIQSNNIRKGVNILGVNGSVVVEDIPPLDFHNQTLQNFNQCNVETLEFILTNSSGFGNVGSSVFYKTGIRKIDPKYECVLTTGTWAANLFRECKSLTTVSHENGGHFTFPNLTLISNIFQACTALKTADMDVFSFQTQNIQMSSIFTGCSALTSIVNLDLTNAKKESDFRIGTTLNKLRTLTFKQGTVPFRYVQDDAEMSLQMNLSYKVPLTIDGIKNMIQSLGTNDTGYARTFVVESSYNLTDEVIALAAAKNYSFRKSN